MFSAINGHHATSNGVTNHINGTHEHSKAMLAKQLQNGLMLNSKDKGVDVKQYVPDTVPEDNAELLQALTAYAVDYAHCIGKRWPEYCKTLKKC